MRHLVRLVLEFLDAPSDVLDVGAVLGQLPEFARALDSEGYMLFEVIEEVRLAREESR
jgi:hypothetical protein